MRTLLALAFLGACSQVSAHDCSSCHSSACPVEVWADTPAPSSGLSGCNHPAYQESVVYEEQSTLTPWMAYRPAFQIQPKFLTCDPASFQVSWDDVNRNSTKGVWDDNLFYQMSGNTYSSKYEGKMVTHVDYSWSCDQDGRGDVVGGFGQQDISTYLKADHRADLTYKCLDPHPYNGLNNDWVCKGVLDKAAYKQSLAELVGQTTVGRNCPRGDYSITRIEIMKLHVGVASVDPQTQSVEGLEPRSYPMISCFDPGGDPGRFGD